MDQIKQDHLEKYFSITETALAAATPAENANQDHAKQILSLAQQYVTDAKHFQEKGDAVRAFAALNYAHGWLDCGAALGIIKGHNCDLSRWNE